MNQVTQDALGSMTDEMRTKWSVDSEEIHPRPGTLDGRCTRCGAEVSRLGENDHDDWHEGLSITIWMEKETLLYLLRTLANIREGIENMVKEMEE
jgi:hypothetical protein